MERRALLIFADAPSRDCTRRGWPSAFRILLEAQSFSFEPRRDFDAHLFTSKASPRQVALGTQIHFQEGASFGDKLQNAIETVAQLGYQEIVIIGQDCPDLESADIHDAFAFLEKHRLVLGPDHRGGCYLIGIRADDRARLAGVHWQRNTDFQQIRDRFADDPVFQLPVKIDLDTSDDIRLLALSKSPFRWVARRLLDVHAPWVRREDHPTLPQLEKQRIHWQLPPPLS